MKRSLLFLALVGMALFAASSSQAATLIVDDTLILPCPGATFNTIQAAVNVAAPGDTIKVCAGTYNEDVNIPTLLTGLTLRGAQSGNAINSRTFAGANESTVNGEIAIRAVSVRVDGFSLTHTAPGFATFAIIVKAAADGALIINNIIDTVINPSVGNSTAQGIYLANDGGTDGPDNISIVSNRINNVKSDRSAKGILIGANGETNPSQNVLIQGNSIENITSVTRGAYGISVASATPGVTGLRIRNNTIDDLNGGGWAHAIGLEGDTPSVSVTDNSISDVVDLTPAAFNNAIAVFFESNPSFSTGRVNRNNFDRVEFGIAVDLALSGQPVDGKCNWWGNASGPGPVGPGTGAKVSTRVTYAPWLTSPAPCGKCGNNDNGHGDDDDHDDNGNHDN